MRRPFRVIRAIRTSVIIFIGMMISELVAVLEGHAPPSLQEDYDNSGLLIGSVGRECSGALCCLDVTPEVLREAKERGCNLVVAHHPIIFKGLKRINGSNYVEQVVIEAIRNDIAIYACHTNLDNVAKGVSDTIAGKLGLIKTKVLQPKKGLLRKLITFAPVADADKVRAALFAAGAGNIGNYSEASFNSEGMGTFKAGEGTNPHVGEIGGQHRERETRIEVLYPFYLEGTVLKALKESHPYEEVAYDLIGLENRHQEIGAGLIGELPEPMEEKDFLHKVSQSFGAEGIRHTELLGRPVRRVAVCGGAGSFLIRTALQQGADIYLTGDIKYHEFFDAEGRMVVADIGHYESEQFAIDLLQALLLEKFPTFAVLKSKVNTNPVRYFGTP